jgi:hypothetical protein
MKRLAITIVSVAAAAMAGVCAAQKGADPAKIRACDVVTGAEVASAAKGKLVSPPLGSGPSCRYTVEVAGGAVEAYQTMFQPAAGAQAVVAAQSPAERGEKIAGLWDEAYAGKRPMADGFSVLAIRRGDIAIEVTGERRDVALAIAKLAASRVR